MPCQTGHRPASSEGWWRPSAESSADASFGGPSAAHSRSHYLPLRTAAAEYSASPAGFRARIALENAQEGLNGQKDRSARDRRRHEPDDRGDRRARGHLEGCDGHRANSALFFSAAKYPQQAGVPVTGNFSDGPEWGEQPYTNMFASDDGSVNPKYPVNTGPAFS